MGEDGEVKTEKQLKAEAKKKAKMEKFAKKQEQQKSKPAAPKEEKSAPKKDKAKKAVVTYDVPTPAGEKKDTVTSFPDSYSPQYVEAAWYQWWEKKGFFKPEYGGRDLSKKNPRGQFVICIPPPNVTGNLHLGHALTNAIEDCLTRWHRMCGRTTLWVPGCDHAGIATQVVVERKLKREKNISRHDIGRENFLNEVWKWKNQKGDRIYHQLRSLGVSVDWERACFTMDDKLNRAVVEAFVRLHDEGLIYRSNRLVNWSCTLNSAISNLEVDKKEISGRTLLSVPGYEQKIEFGVLIHFNYPLEDGGHVTVATTRIETMLGDTGIAVNPTDARYKHLIGKYALHPFCDRKLPIIADDKVDKEFGSGCVKMTPAHDHNDYEIGKRHNLPSITMIDESGMIVALPDFKQGYQKFGGIKRFVARYDVLNALKELGLYVKTEDNAMVVPMCSRSKDIVEPLLKPQWYVDCKDMAASSVAAVRNGDLKMFPTGMHERTWFNWLEDCHDWCISRQLWWGHRVPAYLAHVQGTKCDREEDGVWVSARSESEARSQAAKKLGVSEEKVVLSQDEDVLDTWFSSGLFPFSIFGWPDKSIDLDNLYPTTLLETGHDILFFWVARMTMMGLKLTGKLPFSEVYLHALVRDAYGRKMSKSLGNIIDPLDVISGIALDSLVDKLKDYNLEPKEHEKATKGTKDMFPAGIPECGTDALRFALCAYEKGRDIHLDVLRIQGYRHFCNKLWNATKFAMRNFTEGFIPDDDMRKLSGNESLMDKWILSRLAAAEGTANQGFSAKDFPSVTSAIYNFWLYDLCDVYLESTKPVFQGNDEIKKSAARNVLLTCLDSGLRLLSPFMPFITEELFQRLPRRASDQPESISVAQYPEELSCWRNTELESHVSLMMDVVHTIRSMKEQYVNTKAKPPVYIRTLNEEMKSVVTSLKDDIATLSTTSEIHLLSTEKSPPTGCAVNIVGSNAEVFLLLKGIVDFQKEIEKLQGKQDFTKNQKANLQKAMSIPDYSTKVPENVQQQNTEKIQQLTLELEKLTLAIENFQKASCESDSTDTAPCCQYVNLLMDGVRSTVLLENPVGKHVLNKLDLIRQAQIIYDLHSKQLKISSSKDMKQEISTDLRQYHGQDLYVAVK